MVARWLVIAVAIQTTSRELATDAILYIRNTEAHILSYIATYTYI